MLIVNIKRSWLRSMIVIVLILLFCNISILSSSLLAAEQKKILSKNKAYTKKFNPVTIRTEAFRGTFQSFEPIVINTEAFKGTFQSFEPIVINTEAFKGTFKTQQILRRKK